MRQIISITCFAICLMFSLLLSKCDKGLMSVSSEIESDTKELLNKVWKLDNLYRGGKLIRPPSDKYNIKFYEDGSFNAKYGCNTLIGDYSVGLINSLEITNIETTFLPCWIEFDELYWESLEKVYSYEINDIGLVLYFGVYSSLHYSEE